MEFSDKLHTIVDQTHTLQVQIVSFFTGGCRSGTNLALQMILQQISYTTTTHYHEVSFQSHQEGMLHQTSRSFDGHALTVQAYSFQHTYTITCIKALHPINSLKGSVTRSLKTVLNNALHCVLGHRDTRAVESVFYTMC